MVSDSENYVAANTSLTVTVTAARRNQGYWGRVWTRLLRDWGTLAAISIIALILLAAIFAPLLATHDPTQGSVLGRLKGFGYNGHILGTDETGRDLYSRLLYGSRLTLITGVLPVLLALIIGGFLGVIAGYFGGLINSLIMRVMDVLYAFPSVLLAIAITGMLGSGVTNTILALTITFVPPLVRISETVTSQTRAMDFIEVARSSGAGSFTIIRFHVLSNILAPVLIYATSLISISIILAAGLSFLGLGVTPPNAEWGLMLNNLRSAIWVNPAIAAFPGLMIFITSMSFNLMSDGLRRAMDLKL
ncbi:ABC transporter permease [Rhizobiales bacterium]|uniref:ABC transporter permease n=1 Tax=Hongsoonwoonella zoysiae TaxID=2821844 RepID=UPI0015615E25|nr:ABC transporter permease [Hongsoonwoonella zoysiae]NRG16220.1 ABC transporter permease [Hongsoonwoonella zoysiae]